jgi:hypothetical protein
VGTGQVSHGPGARPGASARATRSPVLSPLRSESRRQPQAECRSAGARPSGPGEPEGAVGASVSPPPPGRPGPTQGACSRPLDSDSGTRARTRSLSSVGPLPLQHWQAGLERARAGRGCAGLALGHGANWQPGRRPRPGPSVTMALRVRLPVPAGASGTGCHHGTLKSKALWISVMAPAAVAVAGPNFQGGPGRRTRWPQARFSSFTRRGRPLASESFLGQHGRLGAGRPWAGRWAQR